MLLAEQYLVIYLFSIFLLRNKDIKIISSYYGVSILLDAIVHYCFTLSPLEYTIVTYLIDLVLFIATVILVQNLKLKIMISCLTLVGMIPTFTILSLSYLLTRDDYFSYLVYLFSKWVAHINNELVLYIMLHVSREQSTRYYYLFSFTMLNYLVIFFK